MLKVRPYARSAAGLAVLQNPTRLAVAAKEGQVSLLDLKMAGGPLDLALVKTFQAHEKFPLSTLASHPSAPIFATGTTSRMLKVWSADGSMIGQIKPSGVGALLGGSSAAGITGLCWSSHKLDLASWGTFDGTSVYHIESHDSSSRMM